MCLSFSEGIKAPSTQCQRSLTMGSHTKPNGDPHLHAAGTTAVEPTTYKSPDEPIRVSKPGTDSWRAELRCIVQLEQFLVFFIL